ncbi:MAG: carboxypeptidase regulatory-like domain-containing protein [Acidobacteria bacterium]|nr:carboxypeptidase regulatory-like domain-containing protein [Acidobacteriota bacterium]MBI3281868.1 carboxypeptidase regulatory-like domain-containing protein [Acidobacteriota bacterium]
MQLQNRALAVVMSCGLAASPAMPQQAPAKLNIVIVEGEGAINNIRQRVAREPIVQVEDENRRPVAGAVVTFLTPNQGPSAVFADGTRSFTMTTDANGRAVARGLRPSGGNGQYQIRVTASKQGQTASATISQTNALVAAAGIAAGKLLAIIAIGGAAAAGGVIAATRGGNGGSTGGPGGGAQPPRTTITPGTPSVGAPR